MKLGEIREFFLNNWRKIGAVVFLILAIGMGLEVGYQRLVATPVVPDSEKLPPFDLAGETAAVKGQVSLVSLSEAELPDKAVAYRAEPLGLTLSESAADELAASFGCSNGPRRIPASTEGDGDILVFFGEGSTLTVATRPRSLSYVAEYATGNEGTLYSQSQALAEAESFMESKGLPVDALTAFRVRFLNSGVNVYVEAADPAKAEFVEALFVWTVGERVLLGASPADVAASLIFDRQGRVVSLKFRYLDSSFTQFGEVELLGSDVAVKQLAESGLVVSANVPGRMSDQAAAVDIYSFAPESTQLVLCQTAANDFLYPVYLFEGSGWSSSGVQVNAAVYLPAVSPEYVKER